MQTSHYTPSKVSPFLPCSPISASGCYWRKQHTTPCDGGMMAGASLLLVAGIIEAIIS